MITSTPIYNEREKRIPLTKVVLDVFKNRFTVTIHFVCLGKIRKIDINAQDTLYSAVFAYWCNPFEIQCFVKMVEFFNSKWM